MKKSFLPHIVLTLLAACLAVTCYETAYDGGGKSQSEGYPAKGEIFLFPDKSSNLLSIYTTKDGDTIWNYGDRDSQGFPSKVTGFSVQAKADSSPTEVLLNSAGQIASIMTNNGVTMGFDWVSATEAVVSMVEKSTGEQFNTLIDFSGTKSAVSLPQGPFVKRSGTATLRVQDVIVPTGEDMVQTKASLKGEGTLTITECNTPVNRQCFVDVFEYDTGYVSFGGGYGGAEVVQKGAPKGRFYCSGVSNGTYKYTLDFDYKDFSDAKPYIEKMAKCVGTVCTVMSADAMVVLLCPGISAGIAAIGLGTTTGAAATFMAACTAAVSAVSLYCSTFGSLGAPGDLSDGVTELFTSTIVQKLGWDENKKFIVRPGVSGLAEKGTDGNTYGGITWFTVGESLPELSLSLGTYPSIESFVTVPAAPAEDQDYQAIATLKCMPEGTVVVMTVVGTDGYDDTMTYTFPETTLLKQVTLTVPGADKGVRDKVTIGVNTPDGEFWQKSVNLVFG